MTTNYLFIYFIGTTLSHTDSQRDRERTLSVIEESTATFDSNHIEQRRSLQHVLLVNSNGYQLRNRATQTDRALLHLYLRVRCLFLIYCKYI
jgi:hypothetical protein